MIKSRAAQRFDVSEAELIAENSAVTHLSTGRRLTYGELASDAAKMAVPVDPASVILKHPRTGSTLASQSNE